jgi:tripartite-type tricarboxylate transporter receptor subunit TctC
VAESGVPDFEVVQWYGLFAPATTPKEIVDKLNREVVAVMKDPDTAKKFAAQGADIVAGSPGDLAKLVQSELAKWGKFIKEAKITAD